MDMKSGFALMTFIGICVFALPLMFEGFEIPPINLVEETHSSFEWTPGWEGQKNAEASGGTRKISSVPDSRVTVPFTGTGIKLYYAKGPEGGIATIELDGESYTFIDMYSPFSQSRVNRTIANGLKNTHHTLQVTVSRIKNLKSSNSLVVVDAIEIIEP